MDCNVKSLIDLQVDLLFREEKRIFVVKDENDEVVSTFADFVEANKYVCDFGGSLYSADYVRAFEDKIDLIYLRRIAKDNDSLEIIARDRDCNQYYLDVLKYLNNDKNPWNKTIYPDYYFIQTGFFAQGTKFEIGIDESMDRLGPKDPCYLWKIATERGEE